MRWERSPLATAPMTRATSSVGRTRSPIKVLIDVDPVRPSAGGRAEPRPLGNPPLLANERGDPFRLARVLLQQLGDLVERFGDRGPDADVLDREPDAEVALLEALQRDEQGPRVVTAVLRGADRDRLRSVVAPVLVLGARFGLLARRLSSGHRGTLRVDRSSRVPDPPRPSKARRGDPVLEFRSRPRISDRYKTSLMSNRLRDKPTGMVDGSKNGNGRATTAWTGHPLHVPVRLASKVFRQNDRRNGPRDSRRPDRPGFVPATRLADPPEDSGERR